MMYITKVQLERVRCYEDETIVFGKPKTSLVICGNNGSGKTTVLRSIALGLCDHISAGALLRDLHGDFIRTASVDTEENRDAVITIDLASAGGRNKYRIRTTLGTRSNVGFEWVRTTISKNGKPLKEYDFPWNSIFVTGYGAGLRTNGSEDYVQYLAPDAVYSLIEYTYPLFNPEIAWKRLIDVAATPKQKRNINGLIIRTLKSILSLGDKKDAISLEKNGIFIKSSWGKQELGALGDGYRALVILTLDILAWKLLAENQDLILANYEPRSRSRKRKKRVRWRAITDLRRLSGIVIIDEIEKHLHPKLQLCVLKNLRDNFPNIQFIVTTHSPLVISSAGDAQTVFLEDGHIGEDKHLQGWLAEDVYKQMGIESSRPVEYRDDIKAYGGLHRQSISTPLAGEDRKAFRKLSQKLAPLTDLAKFDVEVDNLLKALKA